MEQGLRNVLPSALLKHCRATWMVERRHVKSIAPVTGNLFLLREAECELTDQEWALFSTLLCRGLGARHRNNPNFSIYAYDDLVVGSLEAAVPGTEDKWMIILVQGAFYFETSLRKDYARFTRFCLVHELGPEGVFEFCAFIPKSYAPMGNLRVPEKMDMMMQALKRMERDVQELQTVVKKVKAGEGE